MDTEFILKTFMVAIISAITGSFVAPSLLKKIDRKREEVKAQNSLIDELTKVMWSWRYLAKGVVYFAAYEFKPEYEELKNRYNKEVWGILGQYRAQCSIARRLLSDTAYKEFKTFYDYLLDIDDDIMDLVKINVRDRNLSVIGLELSDIFSNEVSPVIDFTLMKVARLFDQGLPPPPNEETNKIDRIMADHCERRKMKSQKKSPGHKITD